jgi:hypothetical protein
MKQIVILLFILTSTFSFGQIYPVQNDSFKTKIEQAVNAKNVLIKKEFTGLNRIKKVDFKFLKVYNFETQVTTKGLYISPKSRRYKKTHYLDSSEIVRMFNYLLFMDTMKFNYFSYNEFKYNICSIDNFNVTMNYAVIDWVWKYSIFINKKKIKRKGRKLNKNEFKQLIEIFGKAKTLLQ